MKIHGVSMWTMLVCLGASTSAWGQEAPPKAVLAVRKFIDENGAKGAGEIRVKDEDAVKQSFPDYDLINVRFRQFPVARILPEGLSPSNVFAVNQDGKVEHLKDVKALHEFCRAHLRAVKNEKDARAALATWLTLSQEYHQDGMLKFEVLAKEFAYEDNRASGRALVMQGGNGQLLAVLLFDKDGKLADAQEKAAIRSGPRPICQATRLLDADPLVRRMAEQDLLIMGLSARDYIAEQRGRASPELRAAIDRLWTRMQTNGW